MKTIMRIFLIIALLAAGFAAGLPVGQSMGFTTGSEWALVQAELLAREAGLNMPVSLQDGQFRVIMKQPRHLYKSAWRLADRYEQEISYVNKRPRVLRDTIKLAVNTAPTQMAANQGREDRGETLKLAVDTAPAQINENEDRKDLAGAL